MARHESDREDLMAEATALRRRGEYRVEAPEPAVVAGFRQDGSLSLYFGSAPAYHFDPQGRLRRAFAGDRLYRTQGETMAELTRVRTAEATELRRHDLDAAELEAFLQEMHERLRSFAAALRENRIRLSRRVPGDDDALTADVLTSIKQVLTGAQPLAPAIKGKR